MSTPFQNRLVGSIVVIAAAIIILPELLDGHKDEQKESFMNVPQRPEYNHVIEVQPQPDDFQEKITQHDVVSDDTAIDDTQPESPTEVAANPAEQSGSVKTDTESSQADVTTEDITASLPAEPQPISEPVAAKVDEDAVAYVVQLGSFRHKENVKVLLRKLRDAGYTSFSRPIKTGSGELTKVFVGPDVNRQRLTDMLGHLKELTGLSGTITRFTPTK